MAPKLRSRIRGVVSEEMHRSGSALSGPSTCAIVCRISYVDREQYFPMRVDERIPVVEERSVLSEPSTSTRAIVCRISYVNREKYFPTAPKEEPTVDERIPDTAVETSEERHNCVTSVSFDPSSTRAIVCRISYVDREKYFPKVEERIPVVDALEKRASALSKPSTSTRAIVCRISYVDREKYFPAVTEAGVNERVPESVVKAREKEEESVASQKPESPVITPAVSEDTAKNANAPVEADEVPLEVLFAALTLADKEEVEEKEVEKEQEKEKKASTQPSRDVTQITLLSVEEEEFRCAICYDIMHRPVKLSCSHYFCRACAIDWMVVCEHRANCSMCRTPTISMTDDVRFTRRVEKYLKLNPDRRRLDPVCTSDIIEEKLEMGARAMEKVAQLLMAANVALPPDC